MSGADEGNPFRSPNSSVDADSVQRPRHCNRYAVIAFLIAAAGGFLVWALSRSVTGADEPWDANAGLYWLATNTIACAAACFAYRARGLAVFVGLWLGQVVAIATVPWLRAAGWLELGVVTTAIGSLLAIPGLLLGLGVAEAWLRPPKQ